MLIDTETNLFFGCPSGSRAGSIGTVGEATAQGT